MASSYNWSVDGNMAQNMKSGVATSCSRWFAQVWKKLAEPTGSET